VEQLGRLARDVLEMLGDVALEVGPQRRVAIDHPEHLVALVEMLLQRVQANGRLEERKGELLKRRQLVVRLIRNNRHLSLLRCTKRTLRDLYISKKKHKQYE